MSPAPKISGPAPRPGSAAATQGGNAKAPILQRSRKDWMAVGVISAVSVIAVAGAMLTANVNNATLAADKVPGKDSVVTVAAEPPSGLKESFTLPSAGVPGQFRPLVSHGLIITNDDHTVTATNADGSTAWTYTRTDLVICSMGSAWDKVVVTYRSGMGCGDVVSIDSATGQYSDTRSAVSSEDVIPVSSNDRVGTVSNDRVEIWRSDMVRTVEYGNVEAPQEPEFQPNAHCTINSALTRTELLVVSETCPGKENASMLRFLKATPEDSRKPEVMKDVEISAPGARLIAVGQNGAAVYVPGATPLIMSYDDQGQETGRSEVPESPAIKEASSPYAPATADLPHNMTWFDGQRLYLLNPTKLTVERVVNGVIGTGVAVGERLLVPTKEGIDVINWSTGKAEKSIRVDRHGYSGPVSLNVAGTSVVESRGNEVAVLAPA